MRGLKIRDARASDRQAVLEFCEQTWPQYGDYIPRVWRRWIRDSSGRFIVAEVDSSPVGIAKITDLGNGEIWLEGLRVDPKHRGKGIANIMNLEVLRTLRKMRPQSVRFCTAATNRASRHIGEKFGFRVVGHFRYYWRQAKKGKVRGDPVRKVEIPSICEYMLQSRFLRLSSGLVAEGWVFRQLSRSLLDEFVRRRQVIVLKQSGRLRGVAIYPYEEADEAVTLGFVEGDEAAVKTLARNCVYIAKARGLPYCSAAVPSRHFARLIEQAGFKRKDGIGQVVLEYRGTGLRMARPRKT